MWKVLGVDHVAIATTNVDEAAAQLFQVLGLAVATREVVASQNTEVALLPVGTGSLELLVPQNNVGLQKFLDKRGPGIHHVAVQVEGLQEMLTDLKARGVQLIDESPRIGARGHKVAFIHPKATGGVLIELVEHA